MASVSSKVRGDGQAVALALGLAMLSLLLGTSLAGHVLLTLLVLWERSLHVSLLPAAAPVPASWLCELSCLLPVLLAARLAASTPGTLLGALGCRLLTFLAGLFCFQVPCLLLGVTRYLAMAHHHFYDELLASWRCVTMLPTCAEQWRRRQ